MATPALLSGNDLCGTHVRAYERLSEYVICSGIKRLTVVLQMKDSTDICVLYSAWQRCNVPASRADVLQRQGIGTCAFGPCSSL